MRIMCKSFSENQLSFEVVIKKTTALQLADFKASENLCEGCPAYGKRWACPPFDTEKSFLFQEKIANIIAIKFKPSQKNLSPKQINDSARKHFDNIFFNIENSTKDTLLLLAGSCICKLADECPKTKNKPCAYPNKKRYSLEALGYNVAKICKEKLGFEILWAKDNAHPQYYTLVYCILTKTDCLSEQFLREKIYTSL